MLEGCLLACLLACFLSLALYFTLMLLLEPLAMTSVSWSGVGANWQKELFETALEASVTSLYVLTGNSWTCLWVPAGVGEGFTRKWCQRGLKRRLDVCVCVCVRACVRAWRFDVRGLGTSASLSIAFVRTPRELAKTIQHTRIVNPLSPVVTICTTSSAFTILRSAHTVYLCFCVDRRRNSDYFTVQH